MTFNLEELQKKNLPHMTLTEAYDEGFKAGLRAFAWWNNGVEVVGISSCIPLKTAITEMKELWNYDPPKEV